MSSFVEEKRIYGEEDTPEFGELPFDHYILDKWDTSSIKSKAAQRDDLVKTWRELGSQGRLHYHHLQDLIYSTGALQLPIVPPGVPIDLQTPQQRAQVANERPSTIWLRTWYGDDETDRSKADEEYAKLCKHVADLNGEFIRGNWAFEDHEQLFSDPVGAATVTGINPSYVHRLLCSYPDILEGSYLGEKTETYIQSGVGVGKQHLMLAVADKRACQTGAVLLSGIDDFGRIVPERLRVKACDVHGFCACWENGQRLDENFRPGEEGEVDWKLGGDAWISPFFRVRPEDRQL